MFQLLERNAEMISATTRIEFHGDERVPASDIKLRVDVEATELNTLSRGLCESLYRTPGKGDQIGLLDTEAAQNAYTAIRHPDLEPLKLKQKFPGYELTLGEWEDEEGSDDSVFVEKAFFAAAEVKNFTLNPREGGTTTVEFTVSCSDVDDDDSLVIRSFLIDGAVCVKLIAPKTQLATGGDGDTLDAQDQADAEAEAARLIEAGKQAA